MTRRIRGSSIVACSAIAVAGCGGSATPVIVASATPAPVLTTAIARGCAYPSLQAQTVALPSAGGVSGTISLGAFSSASSTCLTLTVATAEDATLTEPGTPPSTSSNVRRRAELASTAALPPPVFQTSLYNAFQGEATPIVGVTLHVPSASVPDGSYPATVTTMELDATVVTNYTVVVHNGVLVASGGLFNMPIDPGSSGILTIYPMGTVLPTPAPTATPTGTPTPPTATSTPTAASTATPTAAPSATPVPAPTPTPTPISTAIPADFAVSLSPSGCQQFGYAAASQVFTATASGTVPAGDTLEFGWETSGFMQTVPPPTFMENGPSYTFSPNDTDTVSIPSEPQGYGTGGGITVALFLLEPNGNLVQADSSSGQDAYAQDLIYAGGSTCPTPAPSLRKART